MITWPWVAGRARPAALDIDEFPHVKAWHARVEAREAVRRAMAKAREFVAGGTAGRRPRGGGRPTVCSASARGLSGRRRLQQLGAANGA